MSRSAVSLETLVSAALVGRDAQTVGRWERGEHPLDQTAEMVIRKHALELAGGADDLTMADLARRTAPAATERPFLIDAHDPEAYRALPAAA